MLGFPTETVGTPANRGKARRYKCKPTEKARWRDKLAATKTKYTGLKTGDYRRSKMPAAPMPPPMHMVTIP
jgi:hypothetical protein